VAREVVAGAGRDDRDRSAGRGGFVGDLADRAVTTARDNSASRGERLASFASAVLRTGEHVHPHVQRGELGAEAREQLACPAAACRRVDDRRPAHGVGS